MLTVPDGSSRSPVGAYQGPGKVWLFGHGTDFSHQSIFDRFNGAVVASLPL